MGRCSRAACRHTLDYSAIPFTQVIASLLQLLRLRLRLGCIHSLRSPFPPVAPDPEPPPGPQPWSLGHTGATSSRLGSLERDQSDHERVSLSPSEPSKSGRWPPLVSVQSSQGLILANWAGWLAVINDSIACYLPESHPIRPFPPPCSHPGPLPCPYPPTESHRMT